ncbi:MAG: M6 family metalloprotease domain-containing protein [Gammaproteobacteria bacterium]|jgi:M6 family metalloprotease-like protein
MSTIVGETLVFGQQVGGNVPLVVFGDEFYARYETLAGYTVRYDLDFGCYCYAQLVDGQLVSTGTPIVKRPPLGLRRHLRASSRIRNGEFKTRYQALRPPEPVGETQVMRVLGPNSGLLTGRQVNRGSVRGLTILVEFQDIPCEVSAEDVQAMLNNESYSAHGNFCSVRQYYRLMSSGLLDYANDVVGPVKLSNKQSYYINKPLMAEALDLAVDQFNVDLTRYDSRGEGIVDALSFLYAGRTFYKNWLWPHNSVLELSRNGLQTHYYTIQSLGRRSIDLSIGTFAHETGHMLCRFPDLYDYGERDGDYEKSAGLGRYCLMSSGNHLNGGKTPSPICVYLRDLAGWCTRRRDINMPGQYNALHGEYDMVLRFPTDRPYEYYLVENRSQIGLDAHLPDGGLAVFHCDTRGSNELEDGTPDRHYQCALVQADGHRDLENNFNPGDQDDLFSDISGKAIAGDTRPSTRMWDGSDSGMVLYDVSAPGQQMSFKSGEAPVSTRVTAMAEPDLLIPDNDPQGISTPINVSASGQLASIRVQVDISHTYRGDLEVELEAPSGKLAMLHSKKGGELDNLLLDIFSEDNVDLHAFENEPINGVWILHVRDLLQADVGRLNRWQLTIDYQLSDFVLSAEVNPVLAIPDNQRAGVSSELHIVGEGVVKAVEVEVGITHTYIGDLQIELQSPAGNTALLRPADWKREQNLLATYTNDTTPTLDLFVGESAAGTWVLRVRDLAGYDTGTLDRWMISLTTSLGEGVVAPPRPQMSQTLQ